MLPEPTQPHDDECVFRELFATLPATISALILEPMISCLFGMLCPTDELMSLVEMQTKHHHHNHDINKACISKYG